MKTSPESIRDDGALQEAALEVLRNLANAMVNVTDASDENFEDAVESLREAVKSTSKSKDLIINLLSALEDKLQATAPEAYP